MKKTTTYFAVSSIVVLVFLGIFIYISAMTYSMNEDISISFDRDNYVIPVNSSNNPITVSIDGIDNVDDYSVKWEIIPSVVSVANNNITVGWNKTDIVRSNSTYSSTNNLVIGSRADKVQLTANLVNSSDEVMISVDAYVTVTDDDCKIVDENGVNVNSIYMRTSNSGMQLFVPSRYASYNVNWVSDDPAVASVSSDGYVTPRSQGQTVIRAAISNGDEIVVEPEIPLEISDTDLIGEEGGSSSRDYSLSSLSISDSTLNPTFSPTVSDYNVEITGDDFIMNATPSDSNYFVLIKINDGAYNNLTNDSRFSWSDSGNGQMVLSICVSNGNSSTVGCANQNQVYTVIVTRKPDDNNSDSSSSESGSSSSGGEVPPGGNSNPNNLLDTYLKSLSINGEAIDFSCINSDTSGDQFLCRLDYIAPVGTTRVKVEAEPIDGYEFDIDAGPGEYGVDVGTNIIALEIVKNGEDHTEAVYSVIVSVPTDPNPPASTTNGNGNKISREESSPGTGDMSSFLIFMVMLVSLIASLFVYKKKVENN